MIITLKKKFTSGVAIVCALMILIGILPTNIFGRSNTADAAGNITIYFDNSSGAWSSSSVISVYWLIGSGGNGPNRMTSVTGRTKLYSAEVPSGATGLIFVNGTDWNGSINQTVNIKWNSTKVYHEGVGGDGRTYTSDIVSHTLTDGMCFKLSGDAWSDGSDIYKKMCSQVSGFNPPKTSLAGNTIYVKDMVGDATAVKATFYISDNSHSNTKTLTAVGGKDNLFSTTIPADYSGKPYDTVEISYTTADGNHSNNVKYGMMGEGNSISDSYFNYDVSNCNTYYIRAYGDDEETERKNSCYWERPLNTTSLYSGVYTGTGARRLYFDSDFDGANATIEFGYGGNKVTATNLQYDTTAKMYYYEIPSSPTLTQEDLITVTVGGKTYRMFWFDMKSNIATVTALNKPDGTAAFISDLYRAGYRRIYFDATMSKLSYAGDDSARTANGMGASEMYCSYGTTSAGTSTTTSHKMTKAEPHGDGKNTWNDVYYIDIQDTYKYIRFGAENSSTSSYGRQTDAESIPTGFEKPCFYADSSDNVIYDGGTRDGYWTEAYRIRDNESYRHTDVVDIGKSTFTKDPNKLYVDTTFYDYYSDYELNGNNRDQYYNPAGASYRNWYIYRQFNQALSDYYSENSVQDPLYEGHFQPDYWAQTDDAYRYTKISDTLGLYGFDNYNRFMSNNNSLHDYRGGTYNTGSNAFAYVTQGLANNNLINGTINTYGSDTTVIPFFNEDFLLGNNSKNAKLGEVYNDVSFPFTKVPTSTTNGGTVDYWTFDAAKTTLAMQNDNGNYFLKEFGTSTSLPAWSYNWGSGASGTEDGRKTVHGFFPFNQTSETDYPATYNYGYGMKMEFQFRLTKDGTILDSKGQVAPIEFEFSGDDDVWVYIDDKLVLDLGGQHGKATGTIDFSTNTSTVSAVKPSYNNTSNTGTNVTNKFTLNGDKTTGSTVTHTPSTEHTLVMYYMERGQWESNMRVMFNFPDNNELDVKKVVDYSNVNDMFQKYFETNSNFAFMIRNYATHYEAKDVDTTTIGTAKTFASDFSNFDEPTDTNTKAENINPSIGGQPTDLIHWSSTAENTDRKQTASRLVTIYPDSGKSDYVDASNCEYMRFHIAVPESSGGSDTLALSKMYICLTDSNGKTARGYLTASRLMGVPDVKVNEFNIVRVLLDKLNTDGGFDFSKINYIGFQYDDPAEIYISDFVFQPKPNLPDLTGFVTNQYDIPDYDSVAKGDLTNVTGAVYTADNATATADDDSLRVVGEDSQFFLKNKETVTFSDQFRRGSYIYLNEELTEAQKALFNTKFSVYEDGMPVDDFVNTNNVTNGSIDSLVDVQSTKVDDDRKEKYVIQTVDGHAVNNSGYTTEHRPTDGGFVFRSYLTNDSGTSSLTKLQVVYTNTAKVGNLVIAKDKAEGSNNLDADYTFYVEFYNVGGVALEDDTIIAGPFTLKSGGDPYTELTGIPVGTQFTIHEVQPTDGSSLKEVERLTNGSSSTSVGIKNDTITANEGTFNTRSVSGTIRQESDTYTYRMLNYKYTVMIEIQKNWENLENYKDAEITEVKFHLQRREKGQTDDDWKNVTDISGDPVVITVNKDAASGTGAWTNRSGPYDFYVDNNSANPVYEYRVVELNPDNTEVKDGIYNGNFTVKYDPEYTDGGDGNNPPVNNTLEFNVTNTYVETTDYNAVKEWYDEAGATPTAPAAGTQLTLKLQSTTKASPNDGDWTDVSGKSVTVRYDGTNLTLGPPVDGVTCDFDDPAHSKWKVTFSNLPAKDSDGTTSLHYRVIEASAPSGYEQMVSDYSNDETTKTSTIKNKKVTTADYKVTKQWPDGLPEDGSEITLQLQQTTVDSPTDSDWEPVGSVTDNTIVIRYESNGDITVDTNGSSKFTTDPNLTTGTDSGGVDEWYYQWTDLPTKDSSGKTIKYRVVETEVCDGYFTASQTHDATGSVIVNKKVVNMPSAGSFPFIFNFALFGGIVIAISLVTLHLNKKFNIFQRLLRIIRNVKGV